ncbi:PKD domain-containing protein [Solirubrobacter soli]|uniref:PKD domain-containing protein n=1 Tax=Solirubrobacter soli TaxID=363832 RepID=UPI000406E054|nr:PKD domain-containing protein [Solirubrobacter soli]
MTLTKCLTAALAALALLPAAAHATDDPCRGEDPVQIGDCTADRPLVSTTISPVSPRPGDMVTLKASSPGLGVSYAWDLDGDGALTDATGPSVQRAYEIGTHTVRVRATDQFGRTALEERSVEVDADLKPPTIELMLQPGIQAERELSAVVVGRDADGAIERLELDLDNDGTYEISGPGEDSGFGFWLLRDSITFHTGGERVIRARVTDDDGLTATASGTVNVLEDIPLATISLSGSNDWSSAAFSDEPVYVSAASMFPAVKYEFDLDGDGTYEFDNGPNGVVRPTLAAGPHTIGVRVTDVRGNVVTARTLSRVFSRSQPDSEVITGRLAAAYAYVGEPIDLAAVVGPLGNAGFGVAWDIDGDGEFDDGSGVTSSPDGAAHLMHVYTTPGVHEVRFRVTGPAGVVYEFGSVVTIGASGHRSRLPDLGLSTPGETVWGKERPIAISYDPRNATLEFDLDGDGQFDETPRAAADGFYWAFTAPTIVAVKAVDKQNGETTVRRIQVQPNSTPTAHARLSLAVSRTGSLLADYSATNGQSATCCTAEWDLDGDGVYDDAVGRYPTLRLTAGEHTIGLRITDARGQSSYVRQTFTVGAAPPVPTWTADGGELKVSVAGANGRAIAKEAWDLDGDGAFDDAVGPSVPAPAQPSRVGVAVVVADQEVGVHYAAYAARPAGRLSLRVKVAKTRLAALRSRGLTVKTGCSATCRATVKLTVSKATARKLKLRSTTLGSGKGGATVKVKLTSKARKALRKVRSLKVQVVVTAPGAATVTKRLTISR